MEAMIATGAMSYYPDLNKPFEIYTDASDYQMGAAIIQDEYPIAYCSKKLTDLQRGYNTTEKELLAWDVTVRILHTSLVTRRDGANIFFKGQGEVVCTTLCTYPTATPSGCSREYY